MALMLGPSLQLRFRTGSPLCSGSKGSSNITPWILSLRCSPQPYPRVTRHRLATKAASPPKAAKSRRSNAPQAGRYETVEQSLAKRSSATLLYQSPPLGMGFLGYYLLGGFSLAYAIINFRLHVIDPVPGTPDWVRYSFVGINLFAAIAGLYFLTRPYGTILKISALPSFSSTPRIGPPLHLELQITPLLPFMKPISLKAAAKDTVLSTHLANAKAELTSELAVLQRRSIAFLAFQSIRAWFSMERFIDVRVRNRTLPLRMKVNAARADDHGQTLDKIVKHGL